MTGNDLIPLFQEAAFEVVGYKLDKLTLDTELSDLSLDSVAVMEIVGYVEQKLDVRFNDEDMATITTLRDLSTLIEKAKS
jgi:acyl carrier protein